MDESRQTQRFMKAFMGVATWLACDVPDKGVDREVALLKDPWHRLSHEGVPLMRFILPYIDTSFIRASLQINDDSGVWFSAFCEGIGDSYADAYRGKNTENTLAVDFEIQELDPAGFGLWVFVASILDLVTLHVIREQQAGINISDLDIGKIIKRTALGIMVSRFKIPPPEELVGFKLHAPTSFRFLIT